MECREPIFSQPAIVRTQPSVPKEVELVDLSPDTCKKWVYVLQFSTCKPAGETSKVRQTGYEWNRPDESHR